MKKNIQNKHTNDYSSLILPETEYLFDHSKVKHTFGKSDYDFFDEEKNIIDKIIRVKRISPANKNERWNIIENNKIIFVVDGTKISKKEKEYLRTPEGFNFLLARGKNGIKSLAGLRKELKKIIT